jgi:hypothetical protein
MGREPRQWDQVVKTGEVWLEDSALVSQGGVAK